MKPQIYEMFYAMLKRQPWGQFRLINSIEMEDGSGNCFNVQGYVNGLSEMVMKFIRIP